MRNLKKILALVLALIMSLSLMATASATDFKDDANVGETYRVAVDVLSDLSVFGGDQNGNFNPQDPIRRSEVAAIIYRIATGDTGSEGHKSYTPYNQFADVVDGSWYAGYVTYCANAGYIKGRNDGNFHPNDNVTGYEVLAMILRAVGYDKNNEFVGSNWQTNTASIATQKGVLKNLTGTTLLSQPATREVVAELLFRSILLPKVVWNANSLSYSDSADKVCDVLKLEEIEGVVTANEYADLNNNRTLANGKTRLELADSSTRTVDWTAGSFAEGIKDIGKSRIAYIQGSKVLYLADSGKNVVDDNEGKAITVRNLASTNYASAAHFTNFDPNTEKYCEMRIEFNLRLVDDAAREKFREHCGASWPLIIDNMTQETVDGYQYAYKKVIPAEEALNWVDLAVIKGIFTVADNANKTLGIDGSVWVGTKSGDADDLSDSIGYATFEKEYVKERVEAITEVTNGNWLQVVDNNADGAAEYVLLTNYDLDKVVNSAAKNDTATYYFRGLDIDVYAPTYLDGYTPAVGDIVHYARIDGKAQMHKAATGKAAFKAVSYKDETATDTNGKVWEQSYNGNYTDLPEWIVNVDENVEYGLYLDDYGYIRAYDNKTTYALVTEIYPTNGMNQAWLTSRALTAEVMTAEDGVVKEYNLVNSYPGNQWNPFYVRSNTPWTYAGINDLSNPNYLQGAATHLGTSFEGAMFSYDDDTNSYKNTWTNVAKYTLTDNGINLNTAAQYVIDENKNTVWVEDYVQLKTADVKNTNPLYTISSSDPSFSHYDYVRAVDDTEFFVVSAKGQVIKHFTGYTNVPNLTVSGNGIRSMYAVAERAKDDVSTNSYWVANVIIIEMDHFETNFDSIALIYSNDYKVSGDVKYLQAIDNAKGQIGIIPNNFIWQGQFAARGFYGLSNITATEDANIFRADVTRLYGASGARAGVDRENLTSYGIYYGTVRSFDGELRRSSYITVDVPTANGISTRGVRLAANYGSVWGIDGTYDASNSALDLLMDVHANKQVQVGDEVLFVYAPGSGTTAGFMVDLTDVDYSYGYEYKRDWHPTPDWLWDEADYVYLDQIKDAAVTGTAAPTVSLTVDGKELAEADAADFVNGEASLTIPYASWKDYAGKEVKISVTAAPGNTITVIGQAGTSFADGVAEAGSKTVSVVSAGKGSASATYTCTFTFAAVGTEAKLDGQYVNDDGILTFPAGGNVELYLRTFKLSDGATAEWHFFDLNGGEHTFIQKGDVITGIDNLEDLSSFQTSKTYVTVTSESGVEKIYKAENADVPTPEKTPFEEAMEDYAAAIAANTRSALNAAKAKLEALDRAELTEEQIAQVEEAIAAIDQALANLPEETGDTVTLTLTADYVDYFEYDEAANKNIAKKIEITPASLADLEVTEDNTVIIPAGAIKVDDAAAALGCYIAGLTGDESVASITGDNENGYTVTLNESYEGTIAITVSPDFDGIATEYDPWQGSDKGWWNDGDDTDPDPVDPIDPDDQPDIEPLEKANSAARSGKAVSSKRPGQRAAKLISVNKDYTLEIVNAEALKVPEGEPYLWTGDETPNNPENQYWYFSWTVKAGEPPRLKAVPKTPTDEKATVTVQLQQPQPTGVDIKLYEKSGDTYTEKTAPWVTKDVELNSTFVIAAKAVKTGEKWVPVVAGNDSISFTEDKDGYWYAEVEITEVGSVFNISAKQYIDVKVTPGAGVTAVTPAVDAKTGVITAHAFASKEDPTKYVTEITVDLAEGRVPQFVEKAASANPSYTQVNPTVAYTQVEGFDNRWTITLGNMTKAVEGSLKAVTVPVVTLVSSTPGIVKIDGTGVYPAPDGVVENAVLYVMAGKQPVLEGAEFTLVGPAEEEEGFNKWTLNLTGVTNTTTKIVSSKAYDSFTLTYTEEGNDSDEKRVDLPTPATFDAPGGVATAKIWVLDGYVPAEKESDPKVTVKRTNNTKTVGGKTWNEWELSITMTDSTATYEVTTAASFWVQVNAQAGAENIITPAQQRVDTDKNGVASFEVKLPEGYMPTITVDDLKSLNTGGSTAVDVAYELIDEETFTWEVTLGGTTKVNKNGIITVSAKLLPRVNVAAEGTGVTLVDQTVIAYEKEGFYEAVVNFILADGAALPGTDAVRFDFTPATGYSITGPIEYVAGSGEYQFTVRVDKSTATIKDNIPVTIIAGETVEVTLVLGENLELVSGGELVKKVAKGGTATFTVKAADGFKPVAGDKYTVAASGENWVITIANVTEAMEVEVKAGPAQSNRFAADVVIAGSANGKFTLEDIEEGANLITEGTTFTLTTADNQYGYVPVVEITTNNSTGESKVICTAKFEGDTTIGGTDDNKALVKWSYTLTNVTEAVTITIKAVKIDGGVYSSDGTAVEGVDAVGGASLTDKTHVAKYSKDEAVESGEGSVTFIVLVAGGYAVKDAKVYEGEAVVVPEGYTAYTVTVNKDANDKKALEFIVTTAAANA